MIRGTLSKVVMPPLNCQVIYETDLAFCASYKDWQKGYRVTGVKIPKYPAVTQLSRRAKRWHYLELHCLYHSHPSEIKLRTHISLQVGLTSPLELLSILKLLCNCGYKCE